MKRAIKHQLGTTLVGLMVGMLVSVVGILASLSLYKTLVSVATEAKVDAIHDGQLATTLLAVQLRIQNAGFGLVGNAANIVIAANGNEKNVLWRYKVDGVTTCEGLRRSNRTVNSRPSIALDYVRATGAGCNDVNALTTMTWTVETTLSIFPRNVTEVIDFSLAPQLCSPYGMDEAGNFYVLTLKGKTAANIAGAQHQGSPLKDTEFKVCLPNVRSA
ncbi:MAG TPA: hypothetical protein VIC26_11500 [Marinagarivorans sp.]